MSRLHLYVLCLVLIASGLGLFLYKVLVLRFPLFPGMEESIWHVEARVTFTAKGKSTKVRMFLPQSSPHLSVVNESFISRGYGLNTKKTGPNRQAIWSTRKAAGRQTLYYRSVVRRAETRESPGQAAEPQIVQTGLEGSSLEAAESLIAAIGGQSADLDSFVNELLERLRADQPEGNVRLLLGSDPSAVNRIETAVRVLAQARVPVAPGQVRVAYQVNRMLKRKIFYNEACSRHTET